MNKAALVKVIATKSGITSKQAEVAVRAMINTISESLVKSGEFSYLGFGRLQTVSRKGRPGRNPRTGETITIKPSKSVRFSPSSRLKELLAAA